MKTNFYLIVLLFGTLVLFTGCTAHPLAGKVFSAEYEDGTSVLKFFDNGKVVMGTYYSPEDPADKQPYIWECYNLDTASYYIKEGQVFLTRSGRHFGRAPIDKQQLNLRLFADNELEDKTLKIDNRFKKLRKTNRYAGTTYSCSSMSEDEMELLFIDDSIVVCREADGSRGEVLSYQASDDGYITIKNKFELVPEKKHLKVQALGSTYFFRKTDYEPTEFDAVKAAM